MNKMKAEREKMYSYTVSEKKAHLIKWASQYTRAITLPALEL